MRIHHLTIIPIVFSVTILLGCAAPQPYRLQSSFSEAEMALYLQGGTASISGQAFMKTAGGDVKYGAGNTITLIPGTKYSHEILANLPRVMTPPIDPRWRKTFIATVADGTGNFEFSGLAPGEYYLETTITWKLPDRMQTETGGVVRKVLTLKSGEKMKFMLTP